MNELKSIKIQVNQAVWFYNYLVGNKEIDDYKEMENILKEKAKDNEPAPAPDSENKGEDPGTESESDDSNDSDSQSSADGPDR